MSSQPEYSAYELLNIYNNVIARYGLPRKKLGRPGYAAIAKFGEWCRVESVDPVTWLTYRIGAMTPQYRHALPVEKLVPKSKASLTRFRQWEGFEARVVGEHRRAEAVGHNAVLWANELRPIGEVMKKQLVLDPESCLFQIDLTGGWNPRSELCAACPVADRCVELLTEDVKQRRIGNVGRK